MLRHIDEIGYLCGTIHMASQGFYPLPDVVEAAFAESDKLVLELDFGKIDPVEAAKTVRETIPMTPELQRLMEVAMDTEAGHKLLAYFSSYGIQPREIMYGAPGTTLFTTARVIAEKLGLAVEWGLDRAFYNAAYKLQMEIEGLETLEDQLLPIKQQADELTEATALRNIRLSAMAVELQEAILMASPDHIKAGTYDELFDLVEGVCQGYPELLDPITSRNVKMADKLSAMVNRGERVFCAVGAAHLGGENGIINLLLQKGHNVGPVILED